MDYQKCRPEKCAGAPCPAVKACRKKVLLQLEPGESPFIEPKLCLGCGDCIKLAPKMPSLSWKLTQSFNGLALAAGPPWRRALAVEKSPAIYNNYYKLKELYPFTCPGRKKALRENLA